MLGTAFIRKVWIEVFSKSSKQTKVLNKHHPIQETTNDVYVILELYRRRIYKHLQETTLPATISHIKISKLYLLPYKRFLYLNKVLYG